MKIYLETLIRTLVPFVVTLFVAYLIGSFINVSIDPSNWTADSREFMAICGLCFGGALYWRLLMDGLA